MNTEADSPTPQRDERHGRPSLPHGSAHATVLAGTAIDLPIYSPHSARVSNYLLGGRSSFTTDRELVGQIMAAFPEALLAAWEHKFFTERAALYLARRGLRQFIDIGAGIPYFSALHQIVQGVDPTSRVVYFDNDPIAMAHLQAIMVSDPRGKVGFIDGDLAGPDGILAALAAEGSLDLAQPIALCVSAVLHQLPDEHGPERAVKTLRTALAPGSALMLTHAASDLYVQEMNQVAFVCRQAGVPFYPRPREQVEALFDGWDLVEPGVTTTARWRPIGVPGLDEAACCYAGVAIGHDIDPAQRAPAHHILNHPAPSICGTEAPPNTRNS